MQRTTSFAPLAPRSRFVVAIAVASVLAALALACGGKDAPPPADPTTGSAPSPTTASTSGKTLDSPAASSTAAASDSEPKKHRPFDVVNHCSDVMTVVFGEDPKKNGSRTVAPSGTIDGPRDAEGNQVVWLLDSAGEPLLQVRVTRGMKHVEIGKSCRTLDSH